ncbi:hypothetical protein NC981_02175 [Leptolyngbya sp. DQ-M1]
MRAVQEAIKGSIAPFDPPLSIDLNNAVLNCAQSHFHCAERCPQLIHQRIYIEH